MLETELLFPSHLTQPQKLLLKGALFLPAKLDEVQVRVPAPPPLIARRRAPRLSRQRTGRDWRPLALSPMEVRAGQPCRAGLVRINTVATRCCHRTRCPLLGQGDAGVRGGVQGRAARLEHWSAAGRRGRGRGQALGKQQGPVPGAWSTRLKNRMWPILAAVGPLLHWACCVGGAAAV